LTGKEAKERLEKQYKRQNEHIKENYDRISITLPKGTKERIKELTGKSCNAYISELVIKDLETLKEKKAEPSGSQQEEKTEEESPEPQIIDISVLYKEYGRETILSALGQVEIYDKYGESILHELVEYARTQQIEQD
jgi:hypothetical protein